jgi:hypothetical protein
MSIGIKIDHPSHFRPLVYGPGSCKYDTDNVDKIGDKNDVCPTEPSRKKYDKYDQRDVNGKSDKGNLSQRPVTRMGTHGIM